MSADSLERLSNPSVLYPAVGDLDAVYVPRPGGQPLAFAAIVSSVLSSRVDQPYEAAAKLPKVDDAAYVASISEDDGHTGALGEEITLPIGDDKVVNIVGFKTPVEGEGAKAANSVIELIDEQHRSGKAVAMYYREEDDPINPKPAYRWVLLPRHISSEGQKKTYELFDPQRQRGTYATSAEIQDKIAKSLKAGGVWAYTMTAADKA